MKTGRECWSVNYPKNENPIPPICTVHGNSAPKMEYWSTYPEHKSLAPFLFIINRLRKPINTTCLKTILKCSASRDLRQSHQHWLSGSSISLNDFFSWANCSFSVNSWFFSGNTYFFRVKSLEISQPHKLLVCITNAVQELKFIIWSLLLLPFGYIIRFSIIIYASNDFKLLFFNIYFGI